MSIEATPFDRCPFAVIMSIFPFEAFKESLLEMKQS